MSYSPDLLKQVPLFALLDDEEVAVLAAQVETKAFNARQRIYKTGDSAGRGYVVVSGAVEVTTVDHDGEKVTVDQPGPGEVFGFASMLGETPHHTDALATTDSICIEIDRHDILALIEARPHAGMDLLSVLSHQIHAAQELVRSRATRNVNEVIEEQATRGEQTADAVARFGGSWAFITSFLIALVIYAAVNVFLGKSAWDAYPFILLNLILSMLAAIQAPVIMMSQNRQDQKDRVRNELDFAVNRRAESEIQNLSRRLNLMNEKIGDIEEVLSEQRETPANPP
ncbi:MAG TPA: DUF1003 domain-containing protein [Bryobacteraceae bacterium]